jgi:hypothetical protein
MHERVDIASRRPGGISSMRAKKTLVISVPILLHMARTKTGYEPA